VTGKYAGAPYFRIGLIKVVNSLGTDDIVQLLKVLLSAHSILMPDRLALVVWSIVLRSCLTIIPKSLTAFTIGTASLFML
jgi:hypothetical protein